MSKRPKIQSPHEKRAEREIRRGRRERERAAARRTGGRKRSSKVPDPFILSVSRGPLEEEVPAPVQAWIEREAAEQMARYRRIARQMEKLEPLRREWTADFFRRISGPRGFSVHAGTRKTIPRGQIPRRPRRPWRVIW